MKNRQSIAGKASTCCHCHHAIRVGDRIVLDGRNWVHEECPDIGTMEREQEREWEQPGWQRRGLRREPLILPRPRLRVARAKRPMRYPPGQRGRKADTPPIAPAPPHPLTLLPSVVAAREEARREMAEAIAQARAERAQRLQDGRLPDPDPCTPLVPAEPQGPGKGPPEAEKGGAVGEEPSTLPPLTPEQQEQVEAMERWREQSKSVLSKLVEARMAGNGPALKWMPGAIPAEEQKRRRMRK